MRAERGAYERVYPSIRSYDILWDGNLLAETISEGSLQQRFACFGITQNQDIGFCGGKRKHEPT